MLTCFAGVVWLGIYNGNSWESILLSAAGISVLAYMIGVAIGAVAMRSVDEQIALHKRENPIPDEYDSPGTGNPAAG